jgi:hypothetical protein
MPKIYDDQGNEILEVEDLEKLPEMLKTNEEATKAHDELKTEYEEMKEKMTKLESKDFNFRKLEKASKEEKEKLMEKWSDKEKSFYEEITSLKEKVETSETSRIEGMKDKALAGLAGEDEDLKKQLTEAYEKSIEFGGQPKDQDEVISRMQSAYQYVKGTRPNVNSLNSFAPNTPVFEKKEERFTDTQKGKDILHHIDPTTFPKE